MPAPTHPTSIRLDRDLRKRLRYQAEQQGRTLAQHIVFILRSATPPAASKSRKSSSAAGGKETEE